MPYYDQHVHTHYSFDSTAQFVDYLQQTTNPFVTTEHLEMSNPEDAGRDDLPDYPGYLAEQAALRKQFSNQLRRGIEVGYYEPRLDAIHAYLVQGNYDLTLLSFHHDGQHDYQDESFTHLDLQTHVQAYYQRMLAGLRKFDDADVLAHFDYGLRVLDITPAQLRAFAEPTIREILDFIIKKHMAFELNTKSMYRWQNVDLYAMVLDWYLEAGGKFITLGSDAHTSDKFQSDFATAKEFLHAHGVTQLAVYTQHHAELVDF